jgi:hypothetical protein
VDKAVGRWRQTATSLGIPGQEQDLVASAFEHADLHQAGKLKVSHS